MSRFEFRRRQARKARRRLSRLSRHLPTFTLFFILAILLGALVFGLFTYLSKRQPASAFPAASAAKSRAAAPAKSEAAAPDEDAAEALDEGEIPAADESAATALDETALLILEADRIAAGYDYEKALAMLENAPAPEDSRIAEARASYEAAMAALVPADVKNVPHVFFHTLIVDPAKAFDGEYDSTGYNSVMTTCQEFEKILQALYEQGYVLVRIHDIASETTDENGNPVFSWGTILLPEGKKPLVMSQDDVCYYPYMDGDGFASRLVIGEDGQPTCEMLNEDGTTVTGSYDLIPMLDDFIREHPDFSYRGAKAIIALTGYEGIFGYRTASSYSEAPEYESEKAKAAEMARCLRDNGWELASHSWGHLWMGVSDNPGETYRISDERFYNDTNKWEAEVETLIGPTDIFIYPNGNDVADWRPYSPDNARYQYLHAMGFRYFCNVDASKPFWLQKGDDYLRMARRNLDGFRLYEDMLQADPAKKRLADLFDAAEIFDPARPTPVIWSYGNAGDSADENSAPTEQ